MARIAVGAEHNGQPGRAVSTAQESSMKQGSQRALAVLPKAAG